MSVNVQVYTLLLAILALQSTKVNGWIQSTRTSFVSGSQSTFSSSYTYLSSSYTHHVLSMSSSDEIDIDNLMDMDVIIFSKSSSNSRYLGAVQEDGSIAPLSVWSLEPAFGEYLECLVDEHDRFPGLSKDEITIHSLIANESISYGSRQVGGGKGPGNPHGEESELLYYVLKDDLDGVDLTVKPELEILW
jgi:hypothetical protein